ncbi:uncharacterized protein BKA78DRAFT_69723 [Phyllosticta capitalensis]|uniref:uncharacterized protein n=1 Tax=Phyllosticta capitalensis TaxID=121624 RepID=UPI003130B469
MSRPLGVAVARFFVRPGPSSMPGVYHHVFCLFSFAIQLSRIISKSSMRECTWAPANPPKPLLRCPLF